MAPTDPYFGGRITPMPGDPPVRPARTVRPAPDAAMIYALFNAAEAIGKSLPELERVLADEESGEGGWGPDVTMVPVLRNATNRLMDAWATLRGAGYDPK
jgi:hypothetical protein